MDNASRKEQIIRIQSQSPYPELNEALETKLRTEVLGVTQTFLEGALQEELQGHLSKIAEDRPRRSGYFGMPNFIRRRGFKTLLQQVLCH